MDYHVILASQSPRRQELLQYITTDFSIQVADVDETIPPNMPPHEAVQMLSLKKAQAVAVNAPKNALVIGADTIVFIDGEILGKPADEQQAKEMLSRLSGQTHTVYTGVSLCQNDKLSSFYVSTAVTFHMMDQSEIDAYIRTGEPMDKAGAYGIQGYGARFIKEITGDYFTVMGLPVSALYQELKKWNDVPGNGM